MASRRVRRWSRCRSSTTSPTRCIILVIVLIWSFIYTSWSVMGRFGLVSLGHGGFMGIGAYVTALLWNYFHLTPVARHSGRDARRRDSSRC